MKNEEYYNYTDESSLKDKIINLQQGITLKVNFNSRNEYKREHIGNHLKDEFPDYSIGIHSIETIISINKLITIEANIDFFSQWL